MEISYDPPRRLANLEKHGLDFADLALEFFDSALVVAAKAGRFIAINDYEGRLIVVVVFKPLGTEAISVISMRPASGKEKILYYEHV